MSRCGTSMSTTRICTIDTGIRAGAHSGPLAGFYTIVDTKFRFRVGTIFYAILSSRAEDTDAKPRIPRCLPRHLEDRHRVHGPEFLSDEPEGNHGDAGPYLAKKRPLIGRMIVIARNHSAPHSSRDPSPLGCFRCFCCNGVERGGHSINGRDVGRAEPVPLCDPARLIIGQPYLARRILKNQRF